MSDPQDVQFSLRVVIPKEKQNVVFAEVDNGFADVLLSFLTLPLGTIVRQMRKHFGDEAPTVGSLNTLYQSLENLDSSCFWTDMCKTMLLKARNPLALQCQKLKVNIDDIAPTKYFACGYGACPDSSKRRCIRMSNPGLSRCNCGSELTCQIIPSSSKIRTNCGGFTEESTSFLITDSLRMLPKSVGSTMQILNNAGIRDTDQLEERIVTIGLNERMVSNTVTARSSSITLPYTSEVGTGKKMVIKAIIRKSTNKVLLAQAGEDFIDFLFSLLVIPLGLVPQLLGSCTNLGSIENLYSSIADLDGRSHLKSEDVKRILLKPLIPPEYRCDNHFFSVTEDIMPLLPIVTAGVNFVDLMDKSGFVKGPKMFVVTHDLVVTPLAEVSCLSTINSLKAPLSDIEELHFDIGMQEALSILKASLTSTSALTDALKPMQN